MSEEEKKAIEKVLKETINAYETYYVGSEEILPQISEDYKNSKIILNLIEKQNKVIDLAIKNINQLGGMYHLKSTDNTYSSRNIKSVKMTTEEIKDYFYEKVEVENE